MWVITIHQSLPSALQGLHSAGKWKQDLSSLLDSILYVFPPSYLLPSMHISWFSYHYCSLTVKFQVFYSVTILKIYYLFQSYHKWHIYYSIYAFISSSIYSTMEHSGLRLDVFAQGLNALPKTSSVTAIVAFHAALPTFSVCRYRSFIICCNWLLLVLSVCSH